MTEDARKLNIAAEVDKTRHAQAATDQLLAIGLWDDAMSRLNYTLDPATDSSLISKEISYAISDTYKKTVIEAMDMREAQRSYEANLSAIDTARQMLTRTIDILRG